VAHLTVHRTDRSSASFLVPSARQWLTRRLARWIALQLPSSFLPLVSGLPDGLPSGSLFGFLPRSFRSSVACPTATRTHRSSAYFIVSSARQWLAPRLAGWIAVRLPSLFLLLVSGLPDGYSDASLIGLLHHFFRSSVACPTACRVDRSSASFLVPSDRQWLVRRLAAWIALWLPSSFLTLVSSLPNGLPGGSLFGFLPRSFCSSVA